MVDEWWSFTTDLPSKLKPEEKSSGKWMDQMDPEEDQ